MNTIIIGTDRETEWQLEIFMLHLRASGNTSLPLQLADFGMSDDGKQLAVQMGIRDVIPRSAFPTDMHSWFFKPFAIAAAKGDRVIWLDLDVEITKGTKLPLFFEWYKGEFAAPPDPFMPNRWLTTPQPYVKQYTKFIPTKGMVYNTGVIVTSPKAEIIRRWCEHTQAAFDDHRDIRGDEELLAELIRVGDNGTEVIRRYDAALMLDAPEVFRAAKLRHWTGNLGKQKLREAIDASRERGNA